MRHLGVLTPIGVLRLQVGMRLLDGSTAGMDDRTIALLLAAEHHAQNTPDDPDDGPTTVPTTPVTTGPATTAPTTSGPDDDGPRTTTAGPDDGGPDDGGPDDAPGAG